MKNSRKIGKYINRALALRKVSQKELADFLGITANTVSYWCSDSRIPNTQQIIAIAEYLNVTSDYLLGKTKTATLDENIQIACKTIGISENAANNLISMQGIQNSEEVNEILESDLLKELSLVLLRMKHGKKYLQQNDELTKSVFIHSNKDNGEYNEEVKIAQLIHGIGLQPIYNQIMTETIIRFMQKYSDKIESDISE